MKKINKLSNLVIKYRKSLQDNGIDKREYESLCKILLNVLMKRKIILYYKYEHENKLFR